MICVNIFTKRKNFRSGRGYHFLVQKGREDMWRVPKKCKIM
jgi:hypothetical protein